MAGYKNISRTIWNVILTEAALQLVNGGLMLILLLYLKTKGYSDNENATFFASRFLGVLFISLPLGIYIRNKKLAGFFKTAAVSLPILTLLAIVAIEAKVDWAIYLSFMFWGIAFSLGEISKIPFIMRNAKTENLTKSITLAYATWSFGAVLSGLIIFLLSSVNSEFFDHKNCLIAIALLSLVGIYFSWNIKNEYEPKLDENFQTSKKFSSYNWKKISAALIPTFIIAVGAGMSIPFIPLFFNSVFEMDYGTFSGYGFIAYSLVFGMMLFTPGIKNKLGFALAIPLTQVLSVSCLILLALMEFYNGWHWALSLALIAYILRQPLMNIAQPLTTEIIMRYVGKENHEITASLMALIWNGSFVVSSLIFGLMRKMDIAFAIIFFCTATLYFIAIVWYQFIIRKTLRMGEF